MPTYTIESNGKVIDIEADREPTQEEAAEIFLKAFSEPFKETTPQPQLSDQPVDNVLQQRFGPPKPTTPITFGS